MLTGAELSSVADLGFLMSVRGTFPEGRHFWEEAPSCSAKGSLQGLFDKNAQVLAHSTLSFWIEPYSVYNDFFIRT